MSKLLKTLGTGQGYLKAGFLGFSKSGKTYTAALLAIAAMEHFKTKGPLAMYDTEGGSEYVAKMIEKLTGQNLIGVKSRSFQQLLATAKECEQDGVEMFIVDSVTHVWRELCDTYLDTINRRRKEKSQNRRGRLEFQDWGPIKKTWSEWTDFYLNSKMHIIICGRAGYEYDFERNEETGRRELLKTGVKMKTETEFGFEPSLLVQMLRGKVFDGEVSRLVNQAIVIGDRFGVINGDMTNFKSVRQGKQKELCDFVAELKAVQTFFLPHLKELTPGAHNAIDTTEKSELNVDDEGNTEWYKEKRQRTIFAEEIKAELLKIYPGQNNASKIGKAELLKFAFETQSWTKVENMNSRTLHDGLIVLRDEITRRMAKEFEDEEINKEPPPVDDRDTPIETLLKAAFAAYIIAKQKRVPAGQKIDEDKWRIEAMRDGQKLTSADSADLKKFNAKISLLKVLTNID